MINKFGIIYYGDCDHSQEGIVKIQAFSRDEEIVLTTWYDSRTSVGLDIMFEKGEATCYWDSKDKDWIFDTNELAFESGWKEEYFQVIDAMIDFAKRNEVDGISLTI